MKTINKISLGIVIIALLLVGYAVFSGRLNKSTILSAADNMPLLSDQAANDSADAVQAVVPSSSVSPSVIQKATVIDQKVPFTAQAPTGDWQDERQQDGCEEASALMAVYWAEGKSLNSSIALTQILGASDYELKAHGEFRDISVNDAVQWIYKEYFKYTKVVVKRNVTIASLIAELEKGNVIVAPMQGQELGNPYFTPPGPERHMLLIRGYDKNKKQFITNDPGTKHGQGYRYNQDVLYNAILSYPTGKHLPVTTIVKDVIVVSK